MTSHPTILYAGTYEQSYPRNQQIIRLLRRCGCRVEELHQPFWENFRDKSRGFGSSGSLVLLGIRLLLIYTTLIVQMLVRIRRFDALAIGYIGQLDMLILGSVARLFGKPVLFNPLVTLTDTVVEDREIVSRDSIRARIIGLIDWAALRLATLVIVDTEENADYLVQKFGVSRSQVEVLFVGADEAIFRRADFNHSGNSGLRVLFYGKMIPLHGIETILEAVDSLTGSGVSDISFEIIGSGQQQDRVKQFVEEHPDAAITYRPWVAYRRLPQRIANAEIVLGIFGDGDKSGRVIPNKVFQAMAVGAAIITRDSPAIRDVLANDVSAMLIPPASPAELASAIERLREPDVRTRIGAAAFDQFHRCGSDDAQAQRVATILDRLVPAWSTDRPSGRSL